MNGDPDEAAALRQRVRELEEENEGLKGQLREITASPLSRKSSALSQSSPKGFVRGVSTDGKSPRDHLHLSVPRASSTSSFSGLEVSPRFLESQDLLQTCETEIQKLKRVIENKEIRNELLTEEETKLETQVNVKRQMLQKWQIELENCRKAVTVEQKHREKMRRALALQKETLANEEAQFHTEKQKMEEKRRAWQGKLKTLESEYKNCKATGMQDVDTITKELRALKLARHNSEALLISDSGQEKLQEITQMETELEQTKKALTDAQDEATEKSVIIDTYRSMAEKHGKTYSKKIQELDEGRKDALAKYEKSLQEVAKVTNELDALKNKKQLDSILLKEFREEVEALENENAEVKNLNQRLLNDVLATADQTNTTDENSRRLSNELLSKDKQISLIRGQSEERGKLLEDKDEAITALEKRVNDQAGEYLDKLGAKDETLTQLQVKLDAAQQESKRLADTLQEKAVEQTAASDEQNSVLEALRKESKELQVMSEAQGQEVARLRTEYQTACDEKEAASSRVAALEEEAGALKEEVDSLKEEASTLKEEASTLNEEAGVLKEEAGILKEGTGTLKEEAGALVAEVAVLKEEAGNAQAEATTLKEEATRAKEEVAVLSQELGSTKERLESVTEELESAKEELGSVKEVCSGANERLASAEEQLKSAKEEVEGAARELECAKEEKETLEQQNSEVAELNSHEKNGLVQEVSRLNKILNEMKEEKEGIINDHRELRAVSKKLRSDLADDALNPKWKELEEELREEITKQTKRTKELEDELYWKTEDIEKLQAMAGVEREQLDSWNLEEAEKMKKKEVAHYKELEDKLYWAKDEVSTLRERLAEVESEMALREQSDRIVGAEQLQAEHARFENLTQECTKLKEELSEVCKVSEKKTDSLDTTKRLLEDVQKQVAEGDTERTKLNQDIRELQEEVRELKAKLERAEDAVKEGKREAETKMGMAQRAVELQEEVKMLRERQRESDEQVRGLSADVKKGNEEVARLGDEHRLAEARSREREETMRSVSIEKKVLEGKLEEVQAQVNNERRRSREHSSVSRDIVELAEEKDRLKVEVTNLQKLHVRTLSEETQAFKNEVEEVKRQISRSASPPHVMYTPTYAPSPGASPSVRSSSRKQEWDAKHNEFENNVTLLKVQLEGLSDAMRRSTVAAHQLGEKWSTDEPTVSPPLRPLDLSTDVHHPSSISPKRSISPPRYSYRSSRERT